MAERKLDKNNTKKVVMDVLPTGRKTIRNISIEDRDEKDSGRIEHEEIVKKLIRKREIKDKNHKTDNKKSRKDIDYDTNQKKGRNIKNSIVSFLVIFSGVMIIAVALSLLYSKAVVTITPKISNFDVSGKVTSKSTASLKELKYEILIATSTQTKDVTATKGPLIQTKAKGVIILYNANSTSAQKIIAGTRIADKNGLVYRTSSTVVIPGMKQVGDKKTLGTISVAALADKPGNEYNTPTGSTDLLKIIAYKGTPKYETIYAKIKTEFTGGYVGNKLTVSPKDEKNVVDSLKTSLNSVLEEKVKSNNPKNYIFYPKLSYVEYSVLPMKDTKNENSSTTKSVTIPLVVQGVMRYVVFDRDSIFKFIAKDQIEVFPSTTYKIDGIEDMKVSVENQKDFSPKKGNTLILSIDGKLKMTGTFSEENLREDLIGKKLNESNAIFAKYPSISSAYALITPFWMRSFPNNKEKIIINIKNEQ